MNNYQKRENSQIHTGSFGDLFPEAAFRDDLICQLFAQNPFGVRGYRNEKRPVTVISTTVAKFEIADHTFLVVRGGTHLLIEKPHFK